MAIKPYDVMEVTVRGEASGQAIDNVFWYGFSNFVGAPTLAGWLTNFITTWRASVCPLLTTEYSVLQYRARIVAGMIFLDEPIPPLLPTRSAFRWREAKVVDGGVSDVGTDAPPAHATQTAVSVRKVCTGVLEWVPYTVDPFPPRTPLLEKSMDGGARLSSIAEDLSEAADQNRWTAPFIAAVGNAFDDLMLINTGSPVVAAQMCVVGTKKEGKIRVTDPAGNPTFAYAYVDSFSVNPFVSTQNTRKQRRAN